MKKVYCFGNPDIEEDSLALNIADELNNRIKGIEFVKCTSPDFLLNLDEKESKELVILDVVKGIKDVCVIDDIGMLDSAKTTTMHDFDLGTVLGLMKEAGQLGKVRIIGISSGLNKKMIVKKIINHLKI